MKKGDMVKLKRPNGAAQSSMRFMLHDDPEGENVIAIELNDSFIVQITNFKLNDIDVVNEPLPDCISLRMSKGTM